MNRVFSVVALCTVASAACAGQDHSVTFKPPVMLKTTDGSPVTSDAWAVPYVVDMDGDGKKDLLVGQFMNTKMPWPRKADEREDDISAGTVRYYRNISDTDIPHYAAGIDLQAANGPVSAPNW